jgi:hypothetical protein
MCIRCVISDNFVIDYALNDLGLNRVEIRCGVENLKSRAIPEKLRFTNEGCIREAEWIYEQYIDHLVYGIPQNKVVYEEQGTSSHQISSAKQRQVFVLGGYDRNPTTIGC